jgi:hypothetical protein
MMVLKEKAMDMFCKIIEYVIGFKEYIKIAVDIIEILRAIYAFLKKWLYVGVHGEWIYNT